MHRLSIPFDGVRLVAEAVRQLNKALDDFLHEEQRPAPPHPLFGPLTRKQWGALVTHRPPSPPVRGLDGTMSCRHAHWYLLAALAAIVAGFWPSFFLARTGGSTWHTVHGVSATAWVVARIVQSWLMARGLRVWHRRVAWVALAMLPVMVLSALRMVQVMQFNPAMPPFLAPLLSFSDLPSIAFLIVLVALHGSFLTVEVILMALIIGEARSGQRHRAYPLSLLFFVVVHLAMGPVASSDAWRSFINWFATIVA